MGLKIESEERNTSNARTFVCIVSNDDRDFGEST